MNGEHKTGEGAAPDRFLRLAGVLATVGMGRTAVFDRVRAGSFPKPIKVGRATVWSEREVQDWMRAQIAANRGEGGAQ